MAELSMRRIDYRSKDASAQLLQLRQKLSLQAEIVSPRGRELTKKVFGKALSPGQVVERICNDVREQGLKAVLRYTAELDGVRLDEKSIRVPEKELRQAHKKADLDFLETLRRVRRNIMSFQLGLLHRDAVCMTAGKSELRLRYRPVRRVGVCVPGGRAAYPSTLLMTVCPAQAAGVKEIAVVLPPTPSGASNVDILAACRELGIREVYRIGGAQAVAALAYGVPSPLLKGARGAERATASPPSPRLRGAGEDVVAPVDMIVGPGNIFVTLAKQYVFGTVGIDCLAGPSEVVVLADNEANPDFAAADLIAQAEHDPATSILITWHEPLLDQVQAALEKQLPKRSRGDEARASLENFGALVLARDAEQALAWTNEIAPEHLHIQTANAVELVCKVENAGAIFVGAHSPVALGDYAAGPSHVLPTSGTPRYASGLSANDFLRRTSVIQFTRDGLAELADDVKALAKKESLTAHAASVEIRLR